MRRAWVAALALLVAGCGVQPSGVTAQGEAPTGVAPGVTLYFIDADNRLRPQLRRTGRLGTISEALSLLLQGPGGSGMRTQIASNGPTLAVVDVRPGLIQLRVPLAHYEVTPLGIDQIVCTALGVWVQTGGPRATRVRLEFTLSTVDSSRERTCPLFR